MQKVTFRGSGQLNGPVNIYKVLELEDQVARNLTGQNRHRVINEIMQNHYPGVNIKPGDVAVNIETISKKKKTKSSQNSYRSKKEKKPLTLTNIILWLLFFPFKAAWWLIKKLWQEEHV